MSTFAEKAKPYLAMGWPVFPLHWPTAVGKCSCRNPECSNQGKHPLTEHGFKDASISHDQIDIWSERWPNANIATATGLMGEEKRERRGIAIIDVDGEEGLASLERLEHRNPLPNTPRVKTGNGYHYYFMAPENLGNSVSKLAPKIDIRARGGQIVLPPSLHHSGEFYTWLVPPSNVKLRPFPIWIISRLAEIDRKKRDEIFGRMGKSSGRGAANGLSVDQAEQRIDRFAGEVSGLPNAPCGRNNMLNRNTFIAFRIARETGINDDFVISKMLVAARACGLDPVESMKTIKSAQRSAFSK